MDNKALNPNLMEHKGQNSSTRRRLMTMCAWSPQRAESDFPLGQWESGNHHIAVRAGHHHGCL